MQRQKQLQQQIPLRGMTERKAKAKATGTADSPEGNDRKKSKGKSNCTSRFPGGE
jgi:hypothetical protein